MTVESDEGRVTTRAADGLLEIIIDRPGKMNGFTLKMLRELAEAYTELERDDAYRCGVLHAIGPNFTAGLDLDQVAPMIAEGRRFYPEGLVDPMSLREPKRTKPLVAAVKGICYTIGLELILAADIAIAAEGTRFSQLEVRRGIMATGGATIRMVERGGWGSAMLHLLTGDEFDHREALRCNFVQEAVAAGRELDRAREIARAIAGQAPLAVRATIANARKAQHEGNAAAIAELPEIQAGLFRSKDAAEGLRSFVERRKAKFTGQ